MIAAGGRPDTATAGLVCVLHPVTSVFVWFALFVSGSCTIPVIPLFRSGRELWSNQNAAGPLHFRVNVMEYRNKNSHQSVDLINQFPALNIMRMPCVSYSLSFFLACYPYKIVFSSWILTIYFYL